MNKFLIIASIALVTALVFYACSNTTSAPTQSHMNENTTETNKSVYDFTMETITGEKKSLADYKGKVLVMVNVASKCGLTPQYAEIQEFYNKHQSRGVEVLGFPANNFGAQEPGTNAEIKEFCTKNYGVTFQMFSKISVKGDDIHPLYQYLTQKKQNGQFESPVQWNFQKFVINKEGKVAAVFSPQTSVTDPQFTQTIEKLIQ